MQVSGNVDIKSFVCMEVSEAQTNLGHKTHLLH